MKAFQILALLAATTLALPEAAPAAKAKLDALALKREAEQPATSCTWSSGGIKYPGTCESTTTCAEDGEFYVSNLCPGGATNKCCIYQSCKSGTGSCMNTDSLGTKYCKAAGGKFQAGYCPGTSAIECCVY